MLFYNNECLMEKKILISACLQSGFSFSNEKIYMKDNFLHRIGSFAISITLLSHLSYQHWWIHYGDSFPRYNEMPPKKLGVWNGEGRRLAQLLKSIFSRLLIPQIVVSAIDESLWHLSELRALCSANISH